MADIASASISPSVKASVVAAAGFVSAFERADHGTCQRAQAIPATPFANPSFSRTNPLSGFLIKSHAK